MKIASLHLENYRCFDNFTIDFDERITVLVGVNGSGKTAVLDALSLFLSQAGYPYQRDALRGNIPISDVSIVHKGEKVVYRIKLIWDEDNSNQTDTLEFSFKNQSPNVDICQLCDGNVELLHSKWQRIVQVINTENPLFVAYMAGRFIDESDQPLNHASVALSPINSFDRAFERTIDYASTLAWFNNMDADEARSIRDNGPDYVNPQLAAVREALSKSLLDQYERPRMQGSPPELIIYKKGTDIAYKVSQLSDGYRSMLALVMDLARRMALTRGANVNDSNDANSLNDPHDAARQGSILRTPAIVLIDEVELHLHPAWQQTILTTLMDIFPNTQFVVTTHSPQVLTSIASRHIRILNDGQVYTVNDQTEGAEASRLLKLVFGVDPRPQNLAIVQDLNEYTLLVYGEKWDTPEAEALRQKLSAHFGSDDPRLMELDLHVENSKWERGL